MRLKVPHPHFEDGIPRIQRDDLGFEGRAPWTGAPLLAHTLDCQQTGGRTGRG